MITVPYLRKQSSVHSRIERLLRDTANDRWTDTEVYDAMNDALEMWENRVLIPRYYEITWTSGTYEYMLPDYIGAHADPYIKRTVWGLDVETGSISQLLWRDQISYYIHPDDSGGQSLFVDVTVPSVDGKIIWWMTNGPVPTTIATLNDDPLAADDTTLTLQTQKLEIGNAGYIIIDDEWIAYAGVSHASSATTLNNLIRGVNGTTAASHAQGTNVEWGIAAHRQDLYRQLADQMQMYLHELFLTDASATEKAHHERMLGFYQNRSQEYWKRFTPLRKPKMTLSRSAIGEMPNDQIWAHEQDYDY